jgi:putative heme-binding domain-containing protein
MFSGNIKSEDDQRVVLNMFGQEFIIPKSDIISRNQVETSMMPEGLLDNLTKEEVRDLIAYLRTEKQID